jgi:chemotaxis signal transduction protein
VPVHLVESIIASTNPTPVPGAEGHIRGVFNLRGRVVSVINLATCLNMATEEPTNRVLVVNVGGSTVGIEVGEVSEVLTLGQGMMQATPTELTGTSWVSGILHHGDRLVTVLDLEGLFTRSSYKVA